MGEDMAPVLTPLMRSRSHSSSARGWLRPPHSSEQPQRVLLSLLVQKASLLPSPAAGRAQGHLYVVFYQTFLCSDTKAWGTPRMGEPWEGSSLGWAGG